MNCIHFYANKRLMEFNSEQPDPLSLATHMLTKEMVLGIIARHAAGRTPYELSVVSSMLYEVHEWKIPTTLLIIDPTDEPEIPDPIAVAAIRFLNTCVFIHARRCIQMP